MFEVINGAHISLVGSTLEKQLIKANDIDIYIITPEMSYYKFRKLCNAGKASCNLFNKKYGFECFIETRRGPFKPDPEFDQHKQLHLIIEDFNSIKNASIGMLLKWKKNCNLLKGKTILNIMKYKFNIDNQRIISCCKNELFDIRYMILNELVIYHEWSFSTKTLLRVGYKPLTTPWSYFCFIRHVIDVLSTINNIIQNKYDKKLNTISTFTKLIHDVEGKANNRREILNKWKHFYDNLLFLVDEAIQELETYKKIYYE